MTDEKPSKEHLEFAKKGIEIFSPFLKEFGFSIFKQEVSKYHTKIIWVKDSLFIELFGNTHWHDEPYYYDLGLGEIQNGNFPFAETGLIGLWKLKEIAEPSEYKGDTPFPFGKEIKISLEKKKNELQKYGHEFLEGDLQKFYFALNAYKSNLNKK